MTRRSALLIFGLLFWTACGESAVAPSEVDARSTPDATSTPDASGEVDARPTPEPVDELLAGPCEESCAEFLACIAGGGAAAGCASSCAGGNPCETPTLAAERIAATQARRGGPMVIVHRGSWEVALENTLEAYRGTFELGGDGNEIDIRRTADGVLVCYHDDFVEAHLEAFGDISDYTYAEVSRLAMRDPGRFGAYTRIPTLAEVLVLHQRYAGVVQLDVKVAGIDQAIVDLIDVLDAWDNVVFANATNAEAIITHPDYLPHPCYGDCIAGLTADRRDVDPDAVAGALASGAQILFVDDPRIAAVALGRVPGEISGDPVRPTVGGEPEREVPSAADVLAALSDDAGWDQVGQTDADGLPIRARALAAEQAAWGNYTELGAALAERVMNRSLHASWIYHGIDGAAALRALIRLGDADAVTLSRFVLWRIDPALEPIAWEGYPLSFVDWRMKNIPFVELARTPLPGTATLARDYLALTEDQAREIGMPQFGPAAKALLAADPEVATAQALLADPRSVVRARALLELFARADEQWAQEALAFWEHCQRDPPHPLCPARP